MYIPAGLDRATPAPFIVVNDGGSYLETMVPALDALLAEKRLPHNLVAIFADAVGSSYGPYSHLESLMKYNKAHLNDSTAHGYRSSRLLSRRSAESS